MTRFTMLALVGALTASAVSVPAWAQTDLQVPDLRSPVRSSPNTINPAPIIGHGAATGSIPVPTYHGQPVQTPTPNYGGAIHVPAAGGVRIQTQVIQPQVITGVQVIDAGKVDNRVPANQSGAVVVPQAPAVKQHSQEVIEYGHAQPYVDERGVEYARERKFTNPCWVMQSGHDGKGVALARSRDDDDRPAYRGRRASYRSSDDDDDRGYAANRYYRGGLRDVVDAEDDLVYHREQLIPWKYCKHDGVGLYRPWMYNVKWNYWYGCNYRPFVPGVPDRYSPIMTEYGLYPRGNVPGGMMPVSAAMPVTQPVVDNTLAYGAVTAPVQAPAVYSQPVTYAHSYGYQTQPYGHGIHPGFDDVSYRPRHAGSYSPYVGPYGFGGRFNYGYGPYNYQWSGGYSGFGRTGSFNYWLPQSGLQY